MMQKKKLMYFSSEGHTFYLDVVDTEVGSQMLNNLMRMCDYCFVKNQHDHWHFVKNRKDGDCTSEYFELKDLLADIPLHPAYQNRKMLNTCKFIISPTHAQQVIDQWNKERRRISDLKRPWYDE